MKFNLLTSGVLLAATCLSGCANLQTVHRETEFPLLRYQKDLPPSASYGKAIHLDAQQRVVMVNSIGEYCAEPSPDALAAYASSLGFSLSAPTKGAASLSNALQSSAGSIGLRTQSITLMRDSLYRICEQSANHKISNTQAALLLNRSEDLMMVILAIEQLTGAVTTNQVILNSSSGGSTTAAIVSNQKAMDGLRSDIENLDKDIVKKKTEIGDNKKIVDNTKVDDPSYKDLSDKKDSLAREMKNLTDSKDEKTKLLTTLASNLDSAIANTNTNNSSNGDFGKEIVTKTMSDAASLNVATAVQGMVTEVLRKDYTSEMCMAILTNETAFNAYIKSTNGQYLIDKCLSKFAIDQIKGIDALKALKNYMQQGNSSTIEKWLKENGSPDVTLEDLMNNNKNDGLRKSVAFGLKLI